MSPEKLVTVRRTCLLLFLAVLERATAFESVSPANAIRHVGEQATVCGRVAGAKYAATSKGSSTFLNFDRPYPDHVFTAVIWEEHRGKFPSPPENLAGQRVCVSGRIETYRGRAQMAVSEPSQIQMDRAP